MKKLLAVILSLAIALLGMAHLGNVQLDAPAFSIRAEKTTFEEIPFVQEYVIKYIRDDLIKKRKLYRKYIIAKATMYAVQLTSCTAAFAISIALFCGALWLITNVKLPQLDVATKTSISVSPIGFVGAVSLTGNNNNKHERELKRSYKIFHADELGTLEDPNGVSAKAACDKREMLENCQRLLKKQEKNGDI